MQQIPEKIIVENLTFTFARSGGPGGQNVNKVNTKVTARFSLACLADFLSEAELARLRRALENRLNNRDELVIQVQENRSQLKNREEALLRVRQLLNTALKIRKKRRRTRIPTAVTEKRLTRKKQRSETKRLRKKLY